MPKVLINFRSSEEERARFKLAAAVERLSLSEWIRRLALLRTAELGDRLNERRGKGASRQS